MGKPLSQQIVLGQTVSAALRQGSRALRQRMTDEEKLLWEALRGDKLHGLHFRRQQIIDGYIADFYCHTPPANPTTQPATGS